MMLTDQELMAANLAIEMRERALTLREQEFSQRPPVKDVEHERSVEARERSVETKAHELGERLEAVRIRERFVQGVETTLKESASALKVAQDHVTALQQDVDRLKSVEVSRQQEIEQVRVENVPTIRDASITVQEATSAVAASIAEHHAKVATHIDRVNVETARLTSWEQSVQKREDALAKQLVDQDGLPSQTAQKYRDAQAVMDRAETLERTVTSLEATLTAQQAAQAKTATEQEHEATRLAAIAESLEVRELRLAKGERDLRAAQEKATLLADVPHA